MTTLPRLIIERCHYLAGCTEVPGEITRPFASEAMRCAHALVTDWMSEAGMTVRRDNIGNLRGRFEGEGSATLLLGSHIDSVRSAGKYDGPLGVITAVAAVQRLFDGGRRLPFAIEVLAFADEEGLRFGAPYLGSRALAGAFDARHLEWSDSAGVTMAEAIRAFGGDPARIAEDAWTGDRPLGYVEVHIEQGPVLEELDLPVGVVSAIAGQSRLEITITGEAGHAGTVPMARRRDALVAAAAVVTGIDAIARSDERLVATVGKLDVAPGAANVIPGRAVFSLDVRHPVDSVRLAAVEAMLDLTREVAAERHVEATAKLVSERAAVACSPSLTALLREAIGGEVVEIASGAGHDGVYMSEMTDVAMLFVRCKGGVSHNPAESVSTDDVAVALDVLSRFLDLLARR